MSLSCLALPRPIPSACLLVSVCLLVSKTHHCSTFFSTSLIPGHSTAPLLYYSATLVLDCSTAPLLASLHCPACLGRALPRRAPPLAPPAPLPVASLLIASCLRGRPGTCPACLAALLAPLPRSPATSWPHFKKKQAWQVISAKAAQDCRKYVGSTNLRLCKQTLTRKVTRSNKETNHLRKLRCSLGGCFRVFFLI